MDKDFQVQGGNDAARFTLKIHRGDGMALVAMNWKKGLPPQDLVGFAIEYKEPGGDKLFALNNRLAFPAGEGAVNPNRMSTRLSPIQKWRWVHFPRNAELAGEFTYRVTPVFMDDHDRLSYGEAQQCAIVLARETYPGRLNVTYTRGFISSQAFVDRYAATDQDVKKLLPAKAAAGVTFKPTHPKAAEALAWMGFEARSAILEVLDEAIEKDKTAQARVVAYDLSQEEVVSRLKKLKKRLRIVIDDSKEHGHKDSGESQSARILEKTAGKANVKRQHMGGLQHNKTIVIDGPKVSAVVCGSTNFTWRGLYVQSNNAMVLRGKTAVKVFNDAFDDYWANDKAPGFGATASAAWNDLKLAGIDARVAFCPLAKKNSQLDRIAKDVEKTKSSLFFSLAFLFQTPGAMQDAIKKLAKDPSLFVYGISDKKVKGLTQGIDFQKPDGKVKVVNPEALSGNVPEPFKSEPKGGGGNRMHHKFVVIDFDKPSARVYLGSYNFSIAADGKNGENLLVIRDRRVAVSYMIEALRIFDHHHFRVAQKEAKSARKKLQLKKPPRKAGEKAWWQEDYTNARKIRDRELFS